MMLTLNTNEISVFLRLCTFLFALCLSVVNCSYETSDLGFAQPVSYSYSLTDNEGEVKVGSEYDETLILPTVDQKQKSQINNSTETTQDQKNDAQFLRVRSYDQAEEKHIKENEGLENGIQEPNTEDPLFQGSSHQIKDDFESLRVVNRPKLITDDVTKYNEKDHPYKGLNESNYRTLKRLKKNELSDRKYLALPQAFAYSEKPRKQIDLKSSASGHHKGKKKKKAKHHSEKHSKGGGKDHHSDHHASSGKKGDKGYKGYHKYEKGKKGHHDKESHKDSYNDKKGKKKKHKEEGSHYGEHHKKEGGKKGAKFKESGDHNKGHSTKGEHNIHKKDEYLKKHEFYDEHHEGGDHEKHGGYHEQHGKKHGGKHKSGHHKSGYHDDHHGKKGHHEKGGHHEDHKGHKEAAGHEKHHSHKEDYAHKGGHKDGKKWGYESKHPK